MLWGNKNHPSHLELWWEGLKFSFLMCVPVGGTTLWEALLCYLIAVYSPGRREPAEDLSERGQTIVGFPHQVLSFSDILFFRSFIFNRNLYSRWNLTQNLVYDSNRSSVLVDIMGADADVYHVDFSRFRDPWGPTPQSCGSQCERPPHMDKMPSACR